MAGILSNKNTVPAVSIPGGPFGANIRPVIGGIVQESAAYPFYMLCEDQANEDFIIQE
jgi:hypothetical protein